jgi:hypothetical protein
MLKQRLFTGCIQTLPAICVWAAGACSVGWPGLCPRGQLPGLLRRAAVQHVDGQAVAALHHQRTPMLLDRGGLFGLRMIGGGQCPKQQLAVGMAAGPLRAGVQAVQLHTGRSGGMQYLCAVGSTGAQEHTGRGGGSGVAHGASWAAKGGANLLLSAACICHHGAALAVLGRGHVGCAIAHPRCCAHGKHQGRKICT